MTSTYQFGVIAPRHPEKSVKFPATSYDHAGIYWESYLAESGRAGQTIDLVEIERAAAVLLDAYSQRANVFACGNGGSASIANHMQGDHIKGVRTSTDLLPKVISLSSNVELLTAVANDVAYEDVFAYQLQSQASLGDVLIAVSSSGRSPNIVRALTWAHDHQLHSISLTGFSGGPARELAEVSIHVDSYNYGVVEDLHQGVMHCIAQYLRQSRMTTDEVRATTF